MAVIDLAYVPIISVELGRVGSVPTCPDRGVELPSSEREVGLSAVTLKSTLTASSLYLLAQWLSKDVLYAAQLAVMNPINLPASIVYLPHGIKILCAWIYGWKAVLLLGPAALIHALTGAGVVGAPLALYALGVFLVLVTAPLAFTVMRLFGIDVIDNATLATNWRVLLFVGLVSAVMNAFVVHIVGYSILPTQEHLIGMVRVVTGNMLGLMAVMLIAMLALRWQRGWRQR
jgi:hypothetical protein